MQVREAQKEVHDGNDGRTHNENGSATAIAVDEEAQGGNEDGADSVRDGHDASGKTGIARKPFGLEKVGGNVVEGDDRAVEEDGQCAEEPECRGKVGKFSHVVLNGGDPV